MKRLLLCRHAKSSWKDITLKDIDRPLNKRGKRDAPDMGGRLYARGIRPDMVISSPARRARKTARVLAKATGFSKKNIILLEKVYTASAKELLQVIREFDDSANQVLMVGHNLEITILANILGNLDINNVPTCGIVALDFAVDTWRDVAKGKSSLVFFDYPRKDRINTLDR